MSDAPLEPTPMESILGSGAGGPLTAPTPFTVYSGYLGYTGGLVIGTPTGGNEGAGAINASALWANGVQVLPANYLNLSGGTLTGPLILAADPTAALGTSTKQYVDNNITIVNTSIAGTLKLTGGTMTGPITLAADPAAALQAATKQYVDNTTVSLSGDTMTGPLLLNADPSALLGAATKQYVDNGLALKLNLAGGTMTGMITLPATTPTTLQATTKQYVDGQISTVNTALASYLPIAGGTITGNLVINGTTTLSANPTANLQAATKQYVDNAFSSIIGIPDAPADGSTYGRNNNAWTNVFDAGTY